MENTERLSFSFGASSQPSDILLTVKKGRASLDLTHEDLDWITDVYSIIRSNTGAQPLFTQAPLSDEAQAA